MSGPPPIPASPDGNSTMNPIICYNPFLISTNGLWQGDDPLQFSLTLLIVQLTVVVFISRVLDFILKPLKQPRVIAEIFGGILLGPSGMGKFALKYIMIVFPIRSATLLDMLAELGLVYFLFQVGIEIDISILKRSGKKALVVAVAGMILPFLINLLASGFLTPVEENSLHSMAFSIFMAATVSITAFPALSRILSDLNIINTELGRVAMAAALINDILEWAVLAFAVAAAADESLGLSTFLVILSATAFVLFNMYVVRPAISWVIRGTPEGEEVDEFYVCMILAGALVAGMITDLIGLQPIFGAFVFGLSIPKGPLGKSLVEKVDVLSSGIFLPLFYTLSGIRVSLDSLADPKSYSVYLPIIVGSYLAKLGATLGAGLLYGMPLGESFTLGVLMSCKGLAEMVILNLGVDKKVLDGRSFSILVVASSLMTIVISPVVTLLHKPTRHRMPYMRRAIQQLKPDNELRVLTCVYNPRVVPTMINLLEASHAHKKSPLCVYVLHLVDLAGHGAAMFIVHDSRPHRSSGGPGESTQILRAFDVYAQTSGVTVRCMTAVTPYSSMSTDICNTAEEKCAALIIVPFHKLQAVDGRMQVTNQAFRTVNQNVLDTAPCSVGILIDRGLGGTSGVSASHVAHHLAVLFFGGADDREALAYATRIAEHDGVSLTVLRFIPTEDVAPLVGKPTTVGSLTSREREKQMDDEFIRHFWVRTASDGSVVYSEKAVRNGEDTMAAIQAIDAQHDLMIVGRTQCEAAQPLTSGLKDWSECPELGVIGDLLASSDFGATVSVLILQQYAEAAQGGEGTLQWSESLNLGQQLYLSDLKVNKGSDKAQVPAFVDRG